jgi:hypothetical protein
MPLSYEIFENDFGFPGPGRFKTLVEIESQLKTTFIIIANEI